VIDVGVHPRVTLNDGSQMPVLGLGVYQAPPGRTTHAAVKVALECGYRLIDTAALYRNEADVGNAVRASGIPREDVFITTKLWNSDHGFESARRACQESLRRLGLAYIDLYLIHWPVRGLRRESWRALVQLQKDSLCRSIGVSNYTIAHLEELLANSPVVPSVNQVEFHPFLYQSELLDFCRAHAIQLEAYSPLARGLGMQHPTVREVASRHRRTPAQVLIRWSLQHGAIPIPKSVRPERIRANAQVFDFDLPAGDMQALDRLSEGLHTAWNPEGTP